MPEQPSQSFKLKTEQTFQAAKEIECASIALLATNTLHHSLCRSRQCRIIILSLLKIYSHAYHGLWSARTSFSASEDIGVSHVLVGPNAASFFPKGIQRSIFYSLLVSLERLDSLNIFLLHIHNIIQCLLNNPCSLQQFMLCNHQRRCQSNNVDVCGLC